MLGDMRAIQLSTESIERNSFTLGVIGVAWARAGRPALPNAPILIQIRPETAEIRVSDRNPTLPHVIGSRRLVPNTVRVTPVKRHVFVTSDLV